MPYPATPCFWIESTGYGIGYLRRYTDTESVPGCPLNEYNGKLYSHSAKSEPVNRYPYVVEVGDDGRRTIRDNGMLPWPDDDDPRWPSHCDTGCGYAFTEGDTRQHWTDQEWVRPDTGETFSGRQKPPGAMWNAWWLSDFWKGPDGMSLAVICPNGSEWTIDSRASNCTMPDDREHKCWVRHGTPPMITVDKNGLTCAAGAGSIQAGDYHGFLRDGVLTEG